MSLGMCSFTLALIVAALYLYRIWMPKPDVRATYELLTAASIHTIEAAFLRAGDSGVRDLCEVAERCGRHLAGSLEPRAIERDLAARGFAFDAARKRAMNRMRYLAVVVAALAAAATAYGVTSIGTAVPMRHLLAKCVLLYAMALVGIGLVTYLGTSTARGRAALAMRRAAYPLHLLAEVDPAEAVALYGGCVRARSDRNRTTVSETSSCEYVWASGGEGAHAGGTNHSSSSHGCGGSSCGGSSCGGH